MAGAVVCSSLPAVFKKKEKKVKILLLHKAADTCAASREQTNSGTKYFAEMFCYEYTFFHIKSEFGHEFLRS